MQHLIDLLPTAQAVCSIVALITRAILAILTVRHRTPHTTTRMGPQSTPGTYSGTAASEIVEARGGETDNHNEISRVLRATLHTAKIGVSVTTVLQWLHHVGAL